MAVDYEFDLVGKIGSMALIRREDKDIDYNIFSRLGSELKPGMIWVTSGATEIGRLDYIKRTGCELSGDPEQDKTDYAAQGQSIPMHLSPTMSFTPSKPRPRSHWKKLTQLALSSFMPSAAPKTSRKPSSFTAIATKIATFSYSPPQLRRR